MNYHKDSFLAGLAAGRQLKGWASGGGGGEGGGVIQPLAVTANGTYSPPAGVDGFAPVRVNVPVWGTVWNVGSPIYEMEEES